jgi:hypothetical protein
MNNAVNASCRSRGFEIENLLAATALPQALCLMDVLNHHLGRPVTFQYLTARQQFIFPRDNTFRAC